MLDNRREGGPRENKHPILTSEEIKTKGSEEKSAGGQSLHWFVAPV